MTLNIRFDPNLGLLEVLPGSLIIPAGSFKQRDDIRTATFPDDYRVGARAAQHVHP